MDYRILVAVDSATLRRVVQIAFANEPAELHFCSSVAEACEAALALRPDVVVAGSLADGAEAAGGPPLAAAGPTGGYALCAQLRRDPRLAAVPFVLLTDDAQPFAAKAAAAAGINGSLQRPFTSQALVQKVDALVQRGGRLNAAPPQQVAKGATLAPPSASLPPPPAVRDDAAASGAATEAPAVKLPASAAAADAPAGQRAPPASAGPAGPQVPAVPGWATTVAPQPPTPPKLALPPLPDWDRPAPPAAALGAALTDVPRAHAKLAEAVAQTLAQLAPTLAQGALEAHVREVVEREVVAILWEVVPKLAEAQLRRASAQAAAAATPSARARCNAPP